MNKGFADLRLTTWLRRLKHLINLDFHLQCTVLGHRHKSSARQLLNDLPDALFNRLGISLNCDVRIDWCFIRIRHASELLDLSGKGLLIKTLDVAFNENIQRAFGEDFDECRAITLD